MEVRNIIKQVALGTMPPHVIIGPSFWVFLLASSSFGNFLYHYIISLKTFNRSVHSLAVMTFALHAKGPRFDPEWTHKNNIRSSVVQFLLSFFSKFCGSRDVLHFPASIHKLNHLLQGAIR